jgi:UrcA family protein
MNRTNTFACTTFVAAAILGGCAAPGHVGTPPGPQLTVNYGDLNVSHPAGAQVLLSRLGEASEFVCGGKPDTRDLSRIAAFNHCYNEAMDDAVKSTNRSFVADLYGKPQLVAEDHPIDASMATSGIPSTASFAGRQAPGGIAARPATQEKSVGSRITDFFEGLFE